MNLPNKLTLVRIGCVPVYLVLMSIGTPTANVLAVVVFVFAALTDWLDGHIARSRNLVTNFGKFMDPIADKLLVIPALILMVGQGRVPAWVCIVFVAREFLVSGLRLIAAEQGVVIAAGKLGKAKTVFQILAVLLLTLWVPALYFLEWILLGIALVLSVWSCVEYLHNGRALWIGGGQE